VNLDGVLDNGETGLYVSLDGPEDDLELDEARAVAKSPANDRRATDIIAGPFLLPAKT